MIELRHGDCHDLLENIKPKTVDLALFDPPYFTTDLDFDKNKEGFSLEQAVHQLLTVVKDDGYMALFCSVEQAGLLASIWKLRFTGFWLKPNPTMRTATAKKPKSKAELYCVFAHPNHQVKNLTWNPVVTDGKPYTVVKRNTGYKRGGKDSISRASTTGWTKDGYVASSNKRYVTDVLKGANKMCMKYDERTIHPTQKSLEVIEVLVQWLTNENDTVLDITMGSGTTGVACKKLNRNFIGMEIDKDYFSIAKQRIEGVELPQQKLELVA